MLKLLVQWLKRLWKFSYGGKQTTCGKVITRYQGVQQLPELTNADLEFLFIQLLEGVHQARGKNWAIKYLQRMENRISTDRWIEWLLNFGEKLLISPAPNNCLAERMVQLGELEIGSIGNLAYDIGIRLLTRNLGEGYWETDTEDLETDVEAVASVPVHVRPPQTEITNFSPPDVSKVISTSISETPGVDLIPNLGQLLWEHQTQDLATRTPQNFSPTLNTVKEDTSNATFPNFIHAWEENKEETWVREIPAVTALDESWTNSAPVVESTVDDLLVSLEESTNLVQQVAVGIGIQATEPHAIVEVLSDESNTDTVQAEAWFYKGLQQAKVGNLSGALMSYNKTIELNPNAYEYWFNQGLTLFYLGNFTDAIASYNQALEIKPDFYKGWYNRGTALSELGYFTDAIASFEEALRLKNDYHEAWSGRGLVQLKLGQLQEAIASFDASLQLQPHDPETWYFRGLVLAEAGQNDDAIACYDQALEYYPEYDLAWCKRGVALFNLGKWEEAIANYSQAITINPECYQAWYALAGVKEKLGKTAEAITAYNSATQTKPDFHEAWIDKGVVFASLGEWEEAIASWDKAIAINPDFYLTWFNRGIALDNLGRKEEAITSYDQAIKINPDFHLAWYNRGVALFYLGKFEEAIASYDGALQIQPDYWEAWLGRGHAAGNAIVLEWQAGIYSPIASNNDALNERGYQGKLASYQEGLRYVSPDTHYEGWSKLHLAIGNAHYDRGKRYPTPRHLWLQAATAYEHALITLTVERFPLLHLEILQNLIKTFVVLGETKQAQEYQQHANFLLQSLLNEASRSDEDKKQLALKFISLEQLAVDIAIQCGELAQAWEIAEYNKNACLTWLLSGWGQPIYSPSYTEIHQLLNPETAIVYWHITPCTLRTFVIKYKSPEPIPIFTPVLNFASIDELPVPEAVACLIAYEDWLEQWNQQYQEYHSLYTEETKINHSWRLNMERRLQQLKKILNISAIVQELEDITQLILVPHRSLDKLPLHALFYLDSSNEKKASNAVDFTITYLPSVQIGLSQQSEPIEKIDEKILLSVEQPNITGYSKLKLAKIEAELISKIFTRSQRLQEASVTKQQVKNALLGNNNIFHFIGQVIDNYSQPYQSELVLTDKDKLTLEEIGANQLASYKLITLCASETTNICSQNGFAEDISLVNALLSLGIPHVVSNLWNPESSASILLMTEFYRRIKQNKSAATALAEATLWLKELTADELTKWYDELHNQLPIEGLRIKAHFASELYKTIQMPAHQKLYSHPYYWAEFKVTGNLG